MTGQVQRGSDRITEERSKVNIAEKIKHAMYIVGAVRATISFENMMKLQNMVKLVKRSMSIQLQSHIS